MHVIRVRNVHEALPEGIRELLSRGIPTPSRAGEVLVLPEPVTTVYARPMERVIFWPERNANPFFHFFESLWMLAGRRDLAFLTQFVKTMEKFSDDGKTLHGAYGWRWRNYFKMDQIAVAIEMLRKDPRTRRVVLTMFDPKRDLGADSNDVPCNQQVFLWNLAGRLQMTVTCRSNDIIWGAYGANAVHFSMLQEYIAGMLNLEVGTMYQVSNNYHAYLDTLEPVRCLADQARTPVARTVPASPYEGVLTVEPYSIMSAPKAWDLDLKLFFAHPDSNAMENPFFARVAKPLWYAHQAYKVGDVFQALEIVDQCQATDWRMAAIQWLQRKVKR